jgi:glycosyltransferase involved in cell wall biosynthesis
MQVKRGAPGDGRKNMAAQPTGALRIGIVTDGLEERLVSGEARIANGGVGVYIYNLVKHLLALDRRNQYFLIRCGPGALDIYHGGEARNVFLPRSQATPWGIALDLPYRRLARELSLDLLHYPNQFGGAYPPANIRIVATVHDITPLLMPRNHPWRRVLGYHLLARRSLARCDRVIVQSESTRRDLIAWGLADGKAIVRIPLGVSPPDNLPVADFALRYPLPRPFVLTVGVLEPRKNHRLLLEALELLRRQGEQLDLVIVGRSGWRWRDPRELPQFAALREAVHIYQDVAAPDLNEFYRRAAVFAYPSLYEGFGLPLLEAMAHATPVVASSAGAMPEVAGDAALYADPRDAAGFAAQIQRLLHESQLRTALVAAGRARAREFTWQRTAQLTLDTYHAACGLSPAAAR